MNRRLSNHYYLRILFFISIFGRLFPNRKYVCILINNTLVYYIVYSKTFGPKKFWRRTRQKAKFTYNSRLAVRSCKFKVLLNCYIQNSKLYNSSHNIVLRTTISRTGHYILNILNEPTYNIIVVATVDLVTFLQNNVCIILRFEPFEYTS